MSAPQELGDASQEGYILVTGGAGYIGSHTLVELFQDEASPKNVVVLDNFSNSTPLVFDRMERLTGRKVEYIKGDLTRKEDIEGVFERYAIRVVMHFAGLKSVGESAREPLKYYQHNVAGTLNLMECMRKHRVYQMVFSSSATVYGYPDRLPIQEDASIGALNPYGRTKEQVEYILKDIAASEPGWRIIMLRYFNPAGGHPSGLMGEDPRGPPNNIAPFVAQVACGIRPKVMIFGDDYDTVDGTGVRDFIHIVDLARGHVAALKHLGRVCGCVPYNLGTGRGYSVLELVQMMRKVSGRDIPVEVVGRRAGDVGEVLADGEKAKREMGWEATKGLEEICQDNWRWQSQNPNGYE
ncbi:MAG: UDP-glucose 4-epimerase [Piptocephalis tieghemiana]|nr:MAG: UDP-glucose 4-epimerase [Piptocephalis tieghemiana]